MALAAVAEKDAELKRFREEAERHMQEEVEKVKRELAEQHRLREVELARQAKEAD